MTKKHEWFKSDLTCLKDEEALEYIKQRLKRLNSLMNDVLFILDKMHEILLKEKYVHAISIKYHHLPPSIRPLIILSIRKKD